MHDGDGGVIFTNFADQSIVHIPGAAEAVPITLTTEIENRYANYVMDVKRQRVLFIEVDIMNYSYSIKN